MSEETTTAGTMATNGTTSGMLAGFPPPEVIRSEFERQMAALTPEQRQKAIAEMQAEMQAVVSAAETIDKAEAKAEETVKTEPAPAPAPAPSIGATGGTEVKPEPPKADAEEPEPFPDPSYMVGWGEQAYLWSEEAIDASAYLVSHAAWKKAHPHLSIDAFAYLMVGDKIKRFRPFDGFLLKEEGGGTTGQPIVFLGLAQQPMILATPDGRILESKGPTNVVMHACFSFLKFRTLLQYKGVTHVRIRPIGYHHTLAGGREWMFAMSVEPDEANRRQPKLVSLESALGKGAR